MEANGYHEHEGYEKCQCITFDEKGRIVGSCDTLFSIPKFTSGGVKRAFPFLENIISYFNAGKSGSDPLFIPQVEFECNGYYSVCDFTFMQSEDARGIRRFIWMIYDNSIHYRELLRANVSTKVKLNSMFG
jgi:hypothetical protein